MRLAIAVALAVLAACGSRDKPAASVDLGKRPGEACGAAGDCRQDLVCASGACAASLPAAPSCATPPGTPAIRAGETFDPGDPGPDACVQAVRLPAFGGASDVVVQDLGELQVGATASFAVTTGTSSFTIVSQEVNGTAVDEIELVDPSGVVTVPNTVVPTDVKTPAGVVYYDDVTLTAPDAFYGGFTPVTGAFTAPNTSAGIDRVRTGGGLPPGTWSLVANDWARECGVISGCRGASTSGVYRLHAVTKSAPPSSTGTLDVEVYLLVDPQGPDSRLATAAGAAADPQLARWVATVAGFLARAGLCLGEVTFHELPGWVHARYPNGSVDITGSGPCDPLQQLFTVAAAPRRGVHVFLVEELVAPSQGGAIAIGVDGSIPGPSGFPGTIFGGAAVGMFGELGVETKPGACAAGAPANIGACGTDRIAYVAAHEIGHWLGLYHTTEASGDFFDPLSDTAQCSCSSCAPLAQRTRCESSTVFVNSAACSVSASCGGGSNLMFWLLDPSRSAGDLSRDQGQAVRLNPAVR
jgi:hypothetical protein